MFANNETGDLLPIKEIGELLKIIQLPFTLMRSKQSERSLSIPKSWELIFSVLLPTNSTDQRESASFMQPSQILIISSMVGIRKVRWEPARKISFQLSGWQPALQQATLHQEENFNQVQKLGQKLVHGLAAYDYYVNAEWRSSSICLEPWLSGCPKWCLIDATRSCWNFCLYRFCLYRWYSATQPCPWGALWKR